MTCKRSRFESVSPAFHSIERGDVAEALLSPGPPHPLPPSRRPFAGRSRSILSRLKRVLRPLRPVLRPIWVHIRPFVEPKRPPKTKQPPQVWTGPTLSAEALAAPIRVITGPEFMDAAL